MVRIKNKLGLFHQQATPESFNKLPQDLLYAIINYIEPSEIKAAREDLQAVERKVVDEAPSRAIGFSR
jgi:hypothetical protein